MNLSEFIDTYREAITKRIVHSYPPRYRPAEDDRPLPPPPRSSAVRWAPRRPRSAAPR